MLVYYANTLLRQIGEAQCVGLFVYYASTLLSQIGEA